MRHLRWLTLASIPFLVSAEQPQFNRDIRPILSDKCFACHGPDSPARKSKLRLDQESSARADLGGRSAIVPGDPAKSELIRRITSPQPALRMPPAWSGAKLTDAEIAVMTKWVETGAEWQKHWSFIPPERPPLPVVQLSKWSRNPIDHFVLRRLESQGLQPSPEADRATLIRRVSLDLTGLPPTPAEVDAFLSDTTPEAYGKLVDRLLASPRYGERMAARWLDAARYADTNGYQTDAQREMWRWRDWVIEAFNRNLPFDQFATEQIAGDLLPNATLDQRIATGFNRNHRGNSEGGIVPEEYLAEYAVDRVETMSTVFLGLTLGCARCHNHKYDPFTQREFYQLFSYFNNIAELGRYLKYGNTPPLVQAPTVEQRSKLSELDRKLKAAEREFESLRPAVRKAQPKWEQQISAATDWLPDAGLAKHLPLDEPAAKGMLGGAAQFDGQRVLEVGDHADFGFYDRLTVAAWVRSEAERGAIVTRAADTDEGEGWGVYLENGKVQVNFIKRRLDDSIRLETKKPVAVSEWHHIVVSYDGSRMATGVRIYVDGKPQETEVLVDAINQEFRTKEPLRIGAGAGLRFRGLIDDVRIYSRAVTAEEAAMLAVPKTLSDIAAIPAAKRSEAETAKLDRAFLETAAPSDVTESWKRANEARAARDKFLESVPTVMVMDELPSPKETFVLVRGAYDRPGERVERAVPEVVSPLPAGAPNNRLGLAQWLVSPQNPLTARVTVNRFWQSYFGTGLVRTVEDFGSQGEWPSHPDLLDWLATEFVKSGWNVKQLQKTIVMSATYRQSSKVTPALLSKDPENRLLARGARLRLPAETIRDQALYVGGLLVEKLGGPSVKPYQPAGLWGEVGNGDYKQDSGEGLYRRSLYTFWKRTVPPPYMVGFDSATRESCIVRESRTNTPLQALNLMNEVTFVEAARALAQRVMREAPAGKRLPLAFRAVLARTPSQKELETLARSLDSYRGRFAADPKAAEAYVGHGESPRDTSVDIPELAAFTAITSMLLNLDEAVTKE